MAPTPDIRPSSVLITCLIAAVLLSGCLSGGGDTDPGNETERATVTPDDGLTLSFRSYTDLYSEGEAIVLELDLENTGQARAEEIDVRLFGASFIAGEEPQFPGNQNLRGVDLSDDEPGEQTTVTWQIRNPVDLENGMTEAFPAGVRIRYTYGTTARAAFTIVPGNSFQGNDAPITTDTSAGPIDVDIDISSPKPVYSGGDSTATISVPIRFTNRGDGRVADIHGNPQPIHILRAEFPNSDRATLECPPTVSLFDGTRRIICTAEVPANVFEEQLSVRLELGYDYFERVDTTFRVRGLPGDQSAS